MRSRFFLSALCVTASVAGIGSTVRADVLLSSPIVSVVGSGSAVASALTVTPNNFPVPNTTNNLTTNITLLTAIAPLDLVLQGVNSGGSTQYGVASSVINGTATPFTGFVFQLGTGTGANFIPFTVGASDFFFNLSSPTSTNFTTVSSGIGPVSEIITYSGGSQGAGASGTFTYSLVTGDQVVTPNTFTLRELPVSAAAVPEPGTLALFAATALSGAAFLRRRKNSMSEKTRSSLNQPPERLNSVLVADFLPSPALACA